ncbi:MAG: nucleotidyltransferase substrate binding protein [Prolixibacteraceae bacterium]
MTTEDIRWQQRFKSFNKALNKLTEAVEYIQNELSESDIDIEDENAENVLDEIIREGLIQRFEYTHELAWNVMKDYLLEVGEIKTIGSKDATREAFQAELITDGDVWMEMIKSRNKTSHTYNEKTAHEIYSKIIHDYYPAFLAFKAKMEEKRSGEQQVLFEQ